jgi:drug/metabolite transporter (DMT)-like permease
MRSQSAQRKTLITTVCRQIFSEYGFLGITLDDIFFGVYLTMIGHIGADGAAYGPLVVPVIALTLSKFFEGYSWSVFSVVGIGLILAGNFLVLRVKRKLDR